MRKYVALLGIVAMGTGAFAADITVFDGQTKGSPTGWFGVQEDQEVEGTSTPPIQSQIGQQWDLEAFTLTGTNLGMVGGYNFKDGEDGYMTGDIFISIGAPATGSVVPNYTGSRAVANDYGYDYAVKLNFNSDGTTGTYTVYDLKASDSLLKCSYDGVSNPWKLKAGYGTTDVNQIDKDFTFTSGLTDAQTGFKGDNDPGSHPGSHYAVNGIDLSFIDAADRQNMFLHYTYQCGNDELAGHVPEPGSLMLFGTGLLGLIGFAFGRRKK